MGKPPLCRPRAKKRGVHIPLLAAWDIETEGLGGTFIIGALACCTGERVLFNTLDAILEWIIDHPGYMYLAHNASGYEFAYLYPLLYNWFASHPNCELHPCIQGDTRLIQFRVKQQITTTSKRGKSTTKTVTIDLRDTLCLFNASLEQVAKAFCPEMPKLKENIDFEHVTFDPQNPAHMEYLWRDCDILLAAYPRLCNQLQDTFGILPAVTAGSTAMRAFKESIPEGHVYYRTNRELEDFVRKAYYGGLVLPGKKIGKRGPTGSVDVNAAYAFQMLQWEYPIGSGTGTWTYQPNYQGFYHVVASVPNSIYETVGFNPLPRRTEKGLDWPSGTFETYVSNFEIDYAREKGCHIDVICGYYWTRTERVFDTFIKKCQELELANEGTFKPTIKLLRNALYGKFATQREHVQLLYTQDNMASDSRNLLPYTNEETGDIIEGMYLFKEENENEYMLPHWAAMITAHERIYLMRFVEEAYRRGAKNVYVDTDSLKFDLCVWCDMVADGTLPIGEYYGQFKAEEISKEFVVLGPKCYMGIIDAEKSKSYHIKATGKTVETKAKGIPQRKLKEEAYALKVYEEAIRALSSRKKKPGVKSGREVEFEAVKSTISIIKEHSHVRPEKRSRTITDIRNSAAWNYDQTTGAIYPNGYILPCERRVA